MELELIEWLKSRLPAQRLLRLGIGDDAAVLALGSSGECVATVDLLADGVDFVLGEATAQQIGHKALGANLSDLAAMAAQPVAALVALNLPRDAGLELAKGLYEGLLPLAEKFNLAIAGGDTNVWDGKLVISITALGRPGPRGVLTRGGARPGDKLLVTGWLGGSLAGRHLHVEPRVDEALLLAERYTLHAAIDISDGLALDLHRLCQASRCGAILSANAVPIAPAAWELARSEAPPRRSGLEHALADGEDFELLLAVPPEDANRMTAEQPLAVPLTVIGEITAGPQIEILHADGRVLPLEALGWRHR